MIAITEFQLIMCFMSNVTGSRHMNQITSFIRSRINDRRVNCAFFHSTSNAKLLLDIIHDLRPVQSGTCTVETLTLIIIINICIPEPNEFDYLLSPPDEVV